MAILTLNGGSSSIKIALYDVVSDVLENEAGLRLVLSGSLERIGLPAGHFRAVAASGAVLIDEPRALTDHADALGVLLRWLATAHSLPAVHAVGHRIVHGGPDHTRPELITPDLIATLHTLIPLAPEHLPGELEAIAAVAAAYPNVPQVGCFDTAFHRDRPLVAQIYGLPWRYKEEGVLRYGFHGLSFEYILQELARDGGVDGARGRVIVAHLGNGSSMAAVREGRSMDATMGFTPLGGLVMSTRPGDLDPGLLLYLLDEKHMTAAQLRSLFAAQSGLLGVSGVSSDMRDLLARERDNPRTALAVELYCYTARKALGAMAAVLGGIDTLIFTAGIGEHAAPIRARICAGLGFLGIQLDAERNAAHAAIISVDGAPVTVRVMPTNEELMIARHTAGVLRETRDTRRGA